MLKHARAFVIQRRLFALRPEQQKLFEEASIVTKPELKSLIKDNPNDFVLLDVREPSETAQGIIDNTKMIPVGEVSNAFSNLSFEEFKKRYGFPKPEKDANVVVYCKAGKRAEVAKLHLNRLGYNHVRNYVGSYSDWVSKDNK